LLDLSISYNIQMLTYGPIWKSPQQELAQQVDLNPLQRFAAAYSLYPRQVTKYAASWEFQGDNFPSILKYEFENQTLAELGRVCGGDNNPSSSHLGTQTFGNPSHP